MAVGEEDGYALISRMELATPEPAARLRAAGEVLMTSLYHRWAETLEPREGGTAIVVTDAMLSRLNDAMLEHLTRQADNTLARWLVVSGLAPVSVRADSRRVPVVGGQVDWLTVSTRVEPTILGYVLNLESALTVAANKLALPWWKLAWLRLRGRAAVRLPWDSGDRP